MARSDDRRGRGILRIHGLENDRAVALEAAGDRRAAERLDEFITSGTAWVSEVDVAEQGDGDHDVASSMVTHAVSAGWVIIGQWPASSVR
ncbi:hypothetical protein GCM10022376_12300 [Yimella lutea]